MQWLNGLHGQTIFQLILQLKESQKMVNMELPNLEIQLQLLLIGQFMSHMLLDLTPQKSEQLLKQNGGYLMMLQLSNKFSNQLKLFINLSFLATQQVTARILKSLMHLHSDLFHNAVAELHHQAMHQKEASTAFQTISRMSNWELHSIKD